MLPSPQLTILVAEALVMKEALEQDIAEYSRLLNEKEATMKLLLPFTTAKTMEN